MKLRTTLIITLASVLGAGIASAQQQGTSPKPASKATKAANLAMQRYLNFNEKEDFENAAHGFIGKPDTLTIKNGRGDRCGTSNRTRPTSVWISQRCGMRTTP
jgi:alkyl sulfatase BDS1-like metallo-beta-lactamase superfamily hydrolase